MRRVSSLLQRFFANHLTANLPLRLWCVLARRSAAKRRPFFSKRINSASALLARFPDHSMTFHVVEEFHSPTDKHDT